VTSRPKRWAAAVAKANKAVDAIELAEGDLEEALSELNELKEEYESWKDNLPEGLENSPLGEKLNTVCDLDFDRSEVKDAASEIRSLIEEAEAIDLPRGFGKD
jgi:hypothetical protein